MSAALFHERPVWEVAEPTLPRGGFAACADHLALIRDGRLLVHRLQDGVLVADLPTSAHALASTPGGVLVRDYSRESGTHVQLLRVSGLDFAWSHQLSGVTGDRVMVDAEGALWLRHVPHSPTRSELVRIDTTGASSSVEVPDGLDDFALHAGRLWVTRSPGRKTAAGLRRKDDGWTQLIQAPCTLVHADETGLLVRQPTGRTHGTVSHWVGQADSPTWTVPYDGAVAASGDLVLVARGLTVRALRRSDATPLWSCTLADGRSVRVVRWLGSHALLAVRRGPDVVVDLADGTAVPAPTSPSDSCVCQDHVVIVDHGSLQVHRRP